MTAFDPRNFLPLQILRRSVSKTPPSRSGDLFEIQKVVWSPLDHKRPLAANTRMSLSAHSETRKELRCL